MLTPSSIMTKTAVIPAARIASNPGSIASMLIYQTRTGIFEERGGCDREMTESDRIFDELRDMVSYQARTGRWADKGIDSPFEQGVRSGGLFGQSGALSEDTVYREIVASGSSLVRTIVSVRREDVDALGVSDKEAWERILRAGWRQAASSFGMGHESDIGFAASLHTDNPASLHVHILTWTRAQFTAERIGQNALIAGNGIIRKTFLADRGGETINQDRNFLRELAVQKVKVEMGFSRTEADLTRLNEALARSSFDHLPIPMQRELSDGMPDRLSVYYRELLEAMPASGAGYTQYGSSDKDMQQLYDRFRKELFDACPSLGQVRALYTQTIGLKAIAEGVSDKAGAAYINRTLYNEFDRRVMAGISNALKRDNSVFLHDTALNRRLTDVTLSVLRSSSVRLSDKTVSMAHRDLSEGRGLSQRTCERAYRDLLRWEGADRGSVGDVRNAAIGKGIAAYRQQYPDRAVDDKVRERITRSVDQAIAQRCGRAALISQANSDMRGMDNVRRVVAYAGSARFKGFRFVGKDSIGRDIDGHERADLARILDDRARSQAISLRHDLNKDLIRCRTMRPGGLDAHGKQHLHELRDLVLGSERMQGYIERDALRMQMGYGGDYIANYNEVYRAYSQATERALCDRTIEASSFLTTVTSIASAMCISKGRDRHSRHTPERIRALENELVRADRERTRN